mmetsp:Transcript_61425/g.143735  ORF Transcript_61425/g.143735 Transcript_61425/m.143735 type:complete len:88 (-) Transcript_61425:66-329(-)
MRRIQVERDRYEEPEVLAIPPGKGTKPGAQAEEDDAYHDEYDVLIVEHPVTCHQGVSLPSSKSRRPLTEVQLELAMAQCNGSKAMIG